jgi:hypothetical protein
MLKICAKMVVLKYSDAHQKVSSTERWQRLQLGNYCHCVKNVNCAFQQGN